MKMRTARGGLARPAMGLESELELWLDGEKVKPEQVFTSPATFIRQPLVHRKGRSYHLPTGSAVYFDTGVIEVATPIVEVDRGCAARAGRLLWEGIDLVRAELDAWQREAKRDARLVGFSTHTSVSFDAPPGRRTAGDLALLLMDVLPVPVMLLATNRASGGVGVRPRGERIEVTADFTPDPERMVAAATVICGIVRAMIPWRSYARGMLASHRLPAIRGLKPMPHTSRKGWLARPQCFPHDPYAAGPDARVWRTSSSARKLTLREIAARIVRHFEKDIEAVATPRTMQVIRGILAGRTPSYMDLAERPREYADVGRLCRGKPLRLSRSAYESVVLAALGGRELVEAGRTLRPAGMRGWTQIVFTDPRGRRVLRSLDRLVALHYGAS